MAGVMLYDERLTFYQTYAILEIDTYKNKQQI